MALSSRALTFPACQPGGQQHQTLMLTNSGDTPVAYHFHAPAGGAFRILPARGVVAPHSHQLVGLRFSPQAVGVYDAAVKVGAQVAWIHEVTPACCWRAAGVLLACLYCCVHACAAASVTQECLLFVFYCYENQPVPVAAAVAAVSCS